MLPEKGRFQKEFSSSNHHFSGDMLVFRGVYDMISMCVYTYINMLNSLPQLLQVTPTCCMWKMDPPHRIHGTNGIFNY